MRDADQQSWTYKTTIHPYVCTIVCLCCMCYTQTYISHAIEIGKKRDLHKTSVRTHQKLLFSKETREKKNSAQIYYGRQRAKSARKREKWTTTTTKMMTTATATSTGIAASRLLEGRFFLFFFSLALSPSLSLTFILLLLKIVQHGNVFTGSTSRTTTSSSRNNSSSILCILYSLLDFLFCMIEINAVSAAYWKSLDSMA